MNLQTAIVLKSTTVYCLRDTVCMFTFKSLRPVFGILIHRQCALTIVGGIMLVGDDLE